VITTSVKRLIPQLMELVKSLPVPAPGVAGKLRGWLPRGLVIYCLSGLRTRKFPLSPRLVPGSFERVDILICYRESYTTQC